MYEKGITLMAKKAQSEKYDVSFGDTWFAQSNLSQEELTLADKWIKANEPELETFVDSSLGSGDKISLSYDLGNDTLIGSLTIRDKKNPAYGAVITARSQSAFECLAFLMFKRWEHLDLESLKDAGTMSKRG